MCRGGCRRSRRPCRRRTRRAPPAGTRTATCRLHHALLHLLLLLHSPPHQTRTSFSTRPIQARRSPAAEICHAARAKPTRDGGRKWGRAEQAGGGRGLPRRGCRRRPRRRGWDRGACSLPGDGGRRAERRTGCLDRGGRWSVKTGLPPTGYRGRRKRWEGWACRAWWEWTDLTDYSTSRFRFKLLSSLCFFPRSFADFAGSWDRTPYRPFQF